MRSRRGAIIAKDSFTVIAEGEVFGAALFIMEKLKPGKRPKTADWRFVMILPDGSSFGDTTGDNSKNVADLPHLSQGQGENGLPLPDPEAMSALSPLPRMRGA